MPLTERDSLTPSSNRRLECDEQLDALLSDIQVMLEYVRSEGISVTKELAGQIARLCPPSVAGNTSRVANEDVAEAVPDESQLASALVVHSELAQLIRPSTPTTIRATTIRAGIWVADPTVRVLLILAILSLFAFIFAAFVEASTGTDVTANDSAWGTIGLIAAAGLGSSFYALLTAQKYIRDRTYDPHYSQGYLVRFVLGVVAGFILGYFGTQIFSGEESQLLAAPLLAVVGGFSSEGVSQILQRLSETLVALVRGSGTEQAKSEVKAGVAEARAKVQMRLQDVLATAAEKGAPEPVIRQIKEAIDSVTKHR